jgi:23S rRNA pseudouridine1911/1915/1917 synthase
MSHAQALCTVLIRIPRLLFTERRIHKQYLALVEGHLRETSGVITFSLKRSKNSLKRIPVKKKDEEIDPLVKDAATEYQEVVKFTTASLVSLHPQTGRMHQIRVHLKALGHPILGDQLYGTKKIHTDFPQIKRQMLHASRLDFDLFGTKYLFQGHLPEDFVQALKSLDGFKESGYDYEALEGLLPNEADE